jgi:hypothetical protein
MDMNDTTNRVIAIIVLLLIFIGGWWLIAKNSVKAPPATDTPAASTDTGTTATNTNTNTSNNNNTGGSGSTNTIPTVEANGEAVEVRDQPAGMTVRVAGVQLAAMGWVAVRDSDGRILGAARLDSGVHADVEVPLLRGTVAGGGYQVLIYVDDGDRAFDLYKDSLVMNSDAGVVGAAFTAQ